MTKVLWIRVTLAIGLAAGCGSEGGPMMPAEAEVTIKFLRHDNPNYEKADKAFFAEYMAAAPERPHRRRDGRVPEPEPDPERQPEARSVRL